MQPVHELINRIRWDPEFGKGDFELGFLDRFENEIVRVSLREVVFAPGDHFFFHYTDVRGVSHSVPVHRIRDVYRNGERIWHRPLQPADGSHFF